MAQFRDFTGAETGVAAVGWSGAAAPILTFPRSARRTGQFGIKSLKTVASIGGDYTFDFVPVLGPTSPGDPDLVGKFIFWVRWNVFPDADGHPVGGWVYGINVSQIAGLYIDSSTGNTASIGMGISGFSKSIGTVVKNRWYRVEVDALIHNDVDADATTDFARVTVRVHGENVQSGTEETRSIGTFTATRVSVGGFNVAGPSSIIDMDFDDLIFDVRDDGLSIDVPVGLVVAPVPVDVIDEPQSIGQTGDRDDIDERPFDATDTDFVTIPLLNDQVIIHHRPMCVRGVQAWKANIMVRGAAGNHAILISGVEHTVAVSPVFLFREAVRYADLTEAQFNADTIGLRNKLGTSLDLNAIVSELLCSRAEALLTAEDAARGDTIPMTWVEFVDSAEGMHVWGAQDVGAPKAQPTLPVGDIPRDEVEFQEGRVLQFGTVERGLSDFGGQVEDVTFSWNLNDSDREIRKLLRAEATRCFIGRDVLERVFTVRDRFLEIKPFTLARGILESYTPQSSLQFGMEATSALLRKDRSGRNRQQIPKKRILAKFFADCPEDNLDGPEPIIYGSLSSFPPETAVAGPLVTVGAVVNVAAKGVANAGAAPVGLAATNSVTKYQHTILLYTGDGNPGRGITGAGFQPDVVLIKARNGGSGFASVFRTADHTGTNSQDWNGGLIASGGIESLDTDGFSVGTNTRVNQTGVRYVAICIDKGDESLFRHGTYVGDGLDNKNITILATGWQPSYLFVKNETAGAAVFRGLSHTGDESTLLANSAQTTDLIQLFNANGFQVGTQSQVNTNLQTHYWFAWRNLTNQLDAFFETGTYAGTGSGQTITGLAFQPIWVMQRPQITGHDASWRHTDHPAGSGSTWGTSGDDTFRIESFTLDGFVVDFLASISGATHQFFAIGSDTVTISGGGLTPVNQAVTRFYRISAIVGGVETKLSVIVSATTTPTNRSIKLSWTLVASATSILVYSSDRQDFRQFAFSELAGTAVEFTDDDVPRDQTREQLGNTGSDTRNLGVRENVKYLVYAKLAGGGFSRPGEALIDAILDGDDISADKHSFAPIHGDRKAVITYDAFPNATGYACFRHTSFHSDWRGHFDQRVDVGPGTLSVSDTLVFDRARPPVLLPGAAGGEDKGRDIIGLVPLIHVGTELISGTRYNVLMVAGHACKEVQAVFKSRTDDAGASHGGSGERRDADSYQLVQPSEIGATWLIPGKTSWPFADDFRDKTDADGNTRRYTLVYTTEDPVPEMVLANVLGVEDVGDGKGSLITRVLKQFKHCAGNFLLGDYQSGGYGVTPTFRLDGEEQIDLDTFDDADDQTALRITGGYVGAGMLGNNGEFKSIRTVLAEFAQSCDVDVGINHVGQLFVSILTEFADLSATRIYSDGSGGQGGDMQADSFEVVDVQDRQFNRVIYRYQVRFAESRSRGSGQFERQSDHEEAIEDQTSIDCFGDVLESPPLVLRWIRDSAIANDIARRYLSRVKDPPRRVIWRANISGMSTELGDTVRITHPHGVGEAGWTKNPVRITRHSIDMTSYEVEFEGWDVFRVFFETFILGDETVLPAAFTAATPDQQLFGYLCSEVTGQFSDGTVGKRLR